MVEQDSQKNEGKTDKYPYSLYGLYLYSTIRIKIKVLKGEGVQASGRPKKTFYK